MRRSPPSRRGPRRPDVLRRGLPALLLACAAVACDSRPARPDPPPEEPARRDPRSYAGRGDVRVTHVELDLRVRFDERRLRGSALLSFDRLREDADVLVLDTRDLTIAAVESWSPAGGFDAATFSLAEADPAQAPRSPSSCRRKRRAPG